MLSGLIFATEEAADRPGMLAATLPFGGMTLLEYQARLLMAAGVRHLMVAVGRVTPALLGATSRMGKRGLSVDIVRSAAEAASRAHPLSGVLVVADGLVTTEAMMAAMAEAPADTVLITPDEAGHAGERIAADACWAGIAMIAASRLNDVAALPRDWDFQSALLRTLEQVRARHVALPAAVKRAGHGVVQDAASLTGRSREVLASVADRRRNWIDRFLFTPLTRLVLPLLVKRAAPDWALPVAGGVLGLGGIVATGMGRDDIGLPVSLLAAATLSTGALLSWLRGDDNRAWWQEVAVPVLAALVALALGFAVSTAAGTGTALVLAVALVAAGTLLLRVPAPPRPWFASGLSSVLLLTPFALLDLPTWGLGLVSLHAFASLVAAVEGLRQKP